MPYQLDQSLPIQDRARHLVFLSRAEYESIPREDLIQFLSPLFPETRPKNEPTRTTPKPAAKPVDVSALRASSQSLLALLQANAKVSNPSNNGSTIPPSPPPRRGISFAKK